MNTLVAATNTHTNADIGSITSEAPEVRASALVGRRFIPNFCGGETVVSIVVLAEFLAIVVTVLTRTKYNDNILAEFASISLFLQWIALSSVCCLCMLGGVLNRLPPWRAVIAAYAVLLLITLAVSEMSMWILWYAGHIQSPRPDWYTRFMLQNLLVSIMVNALALRYLLALHQLRSQTLAAANARSAVRRYRIRPHFLFNCLNNIAVLMRRRPAIAEEATEKLADLVRLMLDENREVNAVSIEIDNARKYLALEHLRLEDRLQVHWDTAEESLSVKTPVQILQLLLEHAIQAGIEPLSDGGEINVKIQLDKTSPCAYLDIELAIDIVSNCCASEPTRLSLAKRIAGTQADTTSVSGQLDTQQANNNLSKLTKFATPSTDRVYNTARLDMTALKNIKLRLHDIYDMEGVLTTETERHRLLIKVRHPAEGGRP